MLSLAAWALLKASLAASYELDLLTFEYSPHSPFENLVKSQKYNSFEISQAGSESVQSLEGGFVFGFNGAELPAVCSL